MSEYRRRLMAMQGGDRFPWIEIKSQTQLSLGFNASKFIENMWSVRTGRVITPVYNPPPEGILIGTYVLDLYDESGYPARFGITWGTDYNVARGLFEFNGTIVDISPYLLLGSGYNGDFERLFYSCTRLRRIPRNLFVWQRPTTLAYTFYNCPALTGSTPEVDGMKLWERFPDIPHDQCFRGCTLLDDYAEIPEDWK